MLIIYQADTVEDCFLASASACIAGWLCNKPQAEKHFLIY